jgi:transglutaminase-like putative cysteine protease
MQLRFRFDAETNGTFVLPAGLATPHSVPVGFDVQGARHRIVDVPDMGQSLIVGTPTAAEVDIRIDYATGPGQPYPDGLFRIHDSRFTRAAADLVADARAIADRAGGGREGMEAIIAHTAGMFDYGHPEDRFYDGADVVPQLCGLTQGSCVDINMYLVAALRAAGHEAGYVSGCFIPEAKKTWCDDMHCWVVTRQDGVFEEWDIAHHLKMGTRDVRPGLNPKPGVRVALAHSMGWTVPAAGLVDQKLVGPPGWVMPKGVLDNPASLRITFSGYEELATAA